jgi:hypothetical protein
MGNDPTGRPSGVQFADPEDLGYRGPGRLDNRNSQFIPPLRQRSAVDTATTEENVTVDVGRGDCDAKSGLVAARGTMNAMIIGVLLWAAIGCGLWYLFGH